MGVPGLEGRFAWDVPDLSADPDDAAVVLNRKKADAGGDLFPQFKVDRIPGWRSLGDAEDVRDLAVGREGEVPRRSFRRGKTDTFEGRVRAETMDALRDYEDDLLAAFDDQRTEKIMVVTLHPTLDPTGAGQYFVRARALACDIGEEQGAPQNVSNGWERAGIISVRQSDRRIYALAEKTDSSLAITNANNTDTAACVNAGKVATDPVITVTSSKVATSWAAVKLAGIPGFNSGVTPVVFTRAGNVITANHTGPVWVDGTPLQAGDRFLYADVAGGTAAVNYGLYVVNLAGIHIGEIFQATRVTDADATAEFAQHKLVAVTSGSLNGGRTFEQTTAGAVTVNTTAIAFALPTTAAQGIALTNTTLGVSLIFPALQLLSGDLLVIDFRTRQITLNGVDVPNVLGDKTWWDEGVAGLAAGSNTIELSTPGASGAVAVNLTAEVAWHDAFV